MDGESHVRIPVRIYPNRIEYFYGGPLPEIEEGAVGDLIVERGALKNPDVIRRLNERRQVPFLGKGAKLRVLLNPSPLTEGRLKYLVEGQEDMPMTPRWTHAAELELQEPLFLEFQGTKSARLAPVRCRVPALNREAESLNHAYTLLSAFFEKQRRSHSGNVFKLIAYYDEGKKCWRLLDDRRRQILPLYEVRLAELAKTPFIQSLFPFGDPPNPKG